MNAATTVAAAIAVTRRRIVRRFEEAGATTPDRAIEFMPGHRMERRVFRQFIDSDVLRPAASGGGHWLDRDAWMAFRRKIRDRVLAASGFALALVGLVAMLSR